MPQLPPDDDSKVEQRQHCEEDQNSHALLRSKCLKKPKSGLSATTNTETISCHCQSFLHQELKYDLVNFNSEHFATFVQYSYAVFN